MADLRVNDVPSELMFDLKVMALDGQTTLRALVIEVLKAATIAHNKKHHANYQLLKREPKVQVSK